MSDDIIRRLREAIAAGPTPGPWIPPAHPQLSELCSPDNIADLLDHAEKLRGEHSMMRAILLAEQESKRELAAENEALAADARRYRWLRGREDGRYMTVYAFRTDIDEVCLGEELDAAIDAARAAEQSERREG